MLLAAVSALALPLAGAVVTVPMPTYADTDSTRAPPSKLSKFTNVLKVAKLQAPSSESNIQDLMGYSSSNFFLQVTQRALHILVELAALPCRLS